MLLLSLIVAEQSSPSRCHTDNSETQSSYSTDAPGALRHNHAYQESQDAFSNFTATQFDQSFVDIAIAEDVELDNAAVPLSAEYGGETPQPRRNSDHQRPSWLSTSESRMRSASLATPDKMRTRPSHHFRGPRITADCDIFSLSIEDTNFGGHSPSSASSCSGIPSPSEVRAHEPGFLFPPQAKDFLRSQNDPILYADSFSSSPPHTHNITDRTFTRPTIITPGPEEYLSHWIHNQVTDDSSPLWSTRTALSPGSDYGGSDLSNGIGTFPSPMTPETDSSDYIGRGRGVHRHNTLASRRPPSPYYRHPSSVRTRSSSLASALGNTHLDSSSRSPSIVPGYDNDGTYLQVPRMGPVDASPGLVSSEQLHDGYFPVAGPSSGEVSDADEGFGTKEQYAYTVSLEEIHPPPEDTQLMPNIRPVGSAAIANASKSRRKKDASFICTMPGCNATFTANHNLHSK